MTTNKIYLFFIMQKTKELLDWVDNMSIARNHNQFVWLHGMFYYMIII